MQYICKICVYRDNCDDCKDKKGKRRNVENCSDFVQRSNTQQKIRIWGYYKDNKDPIRNYVCVVNSLGIGKDDDQIFYYFSHWTQVDECRKRKTAGEFIITEIVPYEQKG